MTRSGTTVLLVALLVGVVSRADALQNCAGDCDANGTVTVDELVVASRIVFGASPVGPCAAADLDGNAAVSAAEMQSAVFAYEGGCAAARSVALGAAVGTSNAVVTLSSPLAAPGDVTVVTSTLSTMGNEVVGLQQDIAFSPLTPLVSCAVNPTIGKEASAFALQPYGCTIGVDCTAMRALILSFSNLAPIPDGVQVFGCSVDVSAAAPPAVYPLVSSNTEAADSNGSPVALDGEDGAVIVVLAATPTPAPAVAPASLILERVRLRADNSRRDDRHNGSILAVATVDANAPFAQLIDDIVASGLSFEVVGAGGVAETVSWDAGDCASRVTARGPRLRCVADDGEGFRKVDIRPLSTPNLFKLKLKARDRTFAPPLTDDPLQGVLHTATFARPDFIGGCRVSRSGLVSTCRESGFVPTETPTPTATDTPTPTPTPTSTSTPSDSRRLILSDAIGVPGGTAAVSVLLETPGDVVATENEIHLSAATLTSCHANPATGKGLQYALLPNGCTPGVDCDAMKGIVINFGDLSPIPNGLILYTCDLVVDTVATPGDYLIECTLPGASDGGGSPLPIDCVDSVLTVVAP